MNSIPPAPWRLTGQAVAFLASPLQARLLVNYQTSPVGPYLEHALAGLTRRGPSVTQMGVTSEASKIGGRTLWGFPKELEDLAWKQWKGRIEFRRGGWRFSIRPFGPTLPIKIGAFTRQVLNDQPVTVPCRLRGKWRLAFHGRQLAIFLESFELIVEPSQF